MKLQWQVRQTKGQGMLLNVTRSAHAYASPAQATFGKAHLF